MMLRPKFAGTSTHSRRAQEQLHENRKEENTKKIHFRATGDGGGGGGSNSTSKKEYKKRKDQRWQPQQR